jgi:hypothetical protein
MNDKSMEILMTKKTSSVLGRIKIDFATSNKCIELLMIGKKRPIFFSLSQTSFLKDVEI